MSETDLFTIGYEKASLGDFLRTVQAAGVKLLIDVRDRPQSRRAGFSKRQLTASADEVGISYVHLKPLGTPPEGREAHRRHDHQSFWRIVDERLSTPEAQTSLDEVLRLARAQPCCLVCYEADWRTCHRARVVEFLERNGMVAHHLIVNPVFD